MDSCLYIFSGLPGVGKTTIAKELAIRTRAVLIRIDTIEQALRTICSINVQGEGYRLAYQIVKDNLRLGSEIVFDCVNPWELTRNEIENVAKECGSKYFNIEIICSNKEEHRKRVETREGDINGFIFPTWDEIEKRDYQEWNKPVIRIDSYNKEIDQCVDEIMDKVFEVPKNA